MLKAPGRYPTTPAEPLPDTVATGPTSQAWIDWVIHLDSEPARRNLLITQSYHDLSNGLAAALGRENANWCTFATWASKTAGRFIRNDEVPHVVRLLLGRLQPIHVTLSRLNETLTHLHDDARVDDESVLDAIRATLHDVSQLISAGNLAVYSELAPVFVQTLDTLAADPSPHALDALANSLQPGLSQEGGQSLLASALRIYAAARNERDRRRKAEMMLLANGQTGLHEQIRLQPFIAAAIDAPISDTLADALEDTGESLPRPIAREVQAIVSHAIHPIASTVESLWQQIATRELMTLELPDTDLVLGHDIPAPPGKPLYPTLLDPLNGPTALKFFASYDATDLLRHGRGALDWTSLPERMRYILELFRSRQRDDRLMEPPLPIEYAQDRGTRLPPRKSVASRSDPPSVSG